MTSTIYYMYLLKLCHLLMQHNRTQEFINLIWKLMLSCSLLLLEVICGVKSSISYDCNLHMPQTMKNVSRAGLYSCIIL